MLEGLRIESQWGRDFLHPLRHSLGPLSLLYSGCRLSFPGVKRPGRAVNDPSPSSTEVEERVKLYLCFPLGPHGLLYGALYFHLALAISLSAYRQNVILTLEWSSCTAVSGGYRW